MSPRKVKVDVKGKGKERDIEGEGDVTWVDEHSKPTEPTKFI